MQTAHSRPLISVVIPAYNAAHFLPEALACVYQQQGLGIDFDLDVWLIDDGSTDDTRQVVKQYHGVQYVYQPNKGVAAARNTGINQTAGEYVAFLDADDKWSSDALLILLTEFRKNSDLLIVEGGVTYVFANPQLESHYALDRARGRYIHIGSKLYRRSVFDRVGLFDEQLLNSEDLDFYNRTEDAGLATLTIPRTVLYYYVHGQNMSVRPKQVASEVMKVLHKTLQRRRQIPPTIEPGAA